jgi:hypothetical protein
MANREKGVLDESAILDHAETQYHRGRAPRVTWAHAQRNATCGEWERLSLVLGGWTGKSAPLSHSLARHSLALPLPARSSPRVCDGFEVLAAGVRRLCLVRATTMKLAPEEGRGCRAKGCWERECAPTLRVPLASRANDGGLFTDPLTTLIMHKTAKHSRKSKPMAAVRTYQGVVDDGLIRVDPEIRLRNQQIRYLALHPQRPDPITVRRRSPHHDRHHRCREATTDT